MKCFFKGKLRRWLDKEEEVGKGRKEKSEGKGM